jgi:putative hydrolase of the HAD superfamily
MAPDHLLDRFKKTIEQHHARLIKAGNPHPEVVIEDVWQACLPFEDMAQVKRFAIAFETLTNPVWPMPHLKELLHYCRQSGIVLGIISNAQFYTPYLFRWAFNRDMHQLGFDPDLVFFSYQHAIAKPGPLLFSMASEKLQRYHVTPRQTAYIGNDMRNDMLPAHETGFQTVLFAGDKRSLRLRKNDARCAAYQPDVIITGLHQLISQLNGTTM